MRAASPSNDERASWARPRMCRRSPFQYISTCMKMGRTTSRRRKPVSWPLAAAALLTWRGAGAWAETAAHRGLPMRGRGMGASAVCPPHASSRSETTAVRRRCMVQCRCASDGRLVREARDAPPLGHRRKPGSPTGTQRAILGGPSPRHANAPPRRHAPFGVARAEADAVGATAPFPGRLGATRLRQPAGTVLRTARRRPAWLWWRRGANHPPAGQSGHDGLRSGRASLCGGLPASPQK